MWKWHSDFMRELFDPSATCYEAWEHWEVSSPAVGAIAKSSGNRAWAPSLWGIQYSTVIWWLPGSGHPWEFDTCCAHRDHKQSTGNSLWFLPGASKGLAAWKLLICIIYITWITGYVMITSLLSIYERMYWGLFNIFWNIPEMILLVIYFVFPMESFM